MGCAEADESLFVGRDRLYGLPGEFTVVRCTHCGLIRTNPRPTIETMGAYYPDDYGPYISTKISDGGDNPIRKPGIFHPLLSRIVRFNTTVLPEMKPGSMLEIGCASGSFLAEMASAGWKVRGIEFSPKAAAAAQEAGLDVYSGSVDSAPEPEQPYDLIVGWMVVEHLHEPLDSLKKLLRWTEPGGWLAISLPDAGAIEFRLFKASGYALQLPNHLYHFTPRTIAMLLEKAGWRVERIAHHRVLNNLMGSIGHKLEDLNAPHCIARAFRNYPHTAARLSLILYPLAWLLALLRQTGRMTVLARKPAQRQGDETLRAPQPARRYHRRPEGNSPGKSIG